MPPVDETSSVQFQCLYRIRDVADQEFLDIGTEVERCVYAHRLKMNISMHKYTHLSFALLHEKVKCSNLSFFLRQNKFNEEMLASANYPLGPRSHIFKGYCQGSIAKPLCSRSRPPHQKDVEIGTTI